MEEEFSTLEIQLKNAISESLSNHITSNSVFLAERLLFERDCESNRSILAECYLSENKIYKAYHILKDCKSDQNRYKFAITCLKLNKLKEAERSLLPEFNTRNFLFQQKENVENIPNGAYGFYLLGLICERSQKFSESKEFYQRALNLCPTLWSAYEKLCKMGETVQPNVVFNEAQYKQYEQSSTQQKFKPQSKIKDPVPYEGVLNNPWNIQEQSVKKSNQFVTINQKYQNQQLSSSKKKQTADITPPIQSFQQYQQQQIHKVQNSSTLQKFYIEQVMPIKDIMTLLRRLGEPVYQMHQYKCSEAIELYNKLPANHFNSGWVLCQVGRCFMEIVKYQEAEKHYSEAFRIEPYRLEGIEFYSSCLWHLKKQVELCYLAHQALEKSTFAFETWIAVGNCFSLQKEHENSLKFFNRAIQLNPNQPYGHSLCGSEFMFNEDFSKARKCFENALNLDIRHYNAWWGLGNIYFKQEKYEKALEHFMKAISINQRNPVLYSFMGMTLAAKRDYNEALKYFQQSEVLDENNGLNRFQKANTLVRLERYQDALKELDKLYRMMPKESPIPIQIGRIYKKLGNVPEAQKHFEIALDLEHKDPQRIKALIESLHNNNNELSDDLDV